MDRKALNEVRRLQEMAGIVKEGGNSYSVFEITNNKTGKRAIIVTSVWTLETVIAGIHSLRKSPTTSGGTKELAQDMGNAGHDYKDHFEVKQLASNVSHENAKKVQKDTTDKTGEVYNQEVSVQ